MTKTWTLFCSVVVFGAKTKVPTNVLKSFFWLLDVMLQLSWNPTGWSREGRKEPQKRKHMNEWNSFAFSFEVTEHQRDQGWGGVRPLRYWLANSEPGSWLDTRLNAAVYFSVEPSFQSCLQKTFINRFGSSEWAICCVTGILVVFLSRWKKTAAA